MPKIKCRRCRWLDWSLELDRQDPRPKGEHVCGLHGCCPVDPDGEQRDFLSRGGCGYIPLMGVEEDRQLTFDFDN